MDESTAEPGRRLHVVGAEETPTDGRAPNRDRYHIDRRLTTGGMSELLIGHRATLIEADGKKVARVESDGQNNYAVRAVIDASTTRSLTTRLPEGKRRDKSAGLDELVPLAGNQAPVLEIR